MSNILKLRHRSNPDSVSSPSTSSAPAHTATVLMLEDDDFDAAVTTELLEKFCSSHFDVRRARGLKEAIHLLRRLDIGIVLVDLNVSDSQGLDTVREILLASPHSPVIVLSGDENLNTAVEALQLGAQDFLAKSQLDSESLQRAATFSIQRKAKEVDLNTKAYYDSLTGVANRALLHERWGRSLARSQRAKRNTGVILTDIDNFKAVNDSHGHEAGDKLLIHYSEVLTQAVRTTDMVARLGGDEFVIVLENVRGWGDIKVVTDQLASLQPMSLQYGKKEIMFSASMGAALSDPVDGEDLLTVLRRADGAMYKAKGEGS